MNTLYTISLYLHSWNRWIVLAAGVAVIAMALNGCRKQCEYGKQHKIASLIFMSSLHLQLLLGLLLYFVFSPFTMHALSDFGAAMKNSTLRFWAVEHSFLNIVAIVLAQTGSILVKRKADARSKHKSTIIWMGIAFVLILLMIPMGFMGEARPWFRL